MSAAAFVSFRVACALPDVWSTRVTHRALGSLAIDREVRAGQEFVGTVADRATYGTTRRTSFDAGLMPAAFCATTRT